MTTPETTEHLIETLTEGIANLATTEAWRDWLEVQRAFHRYRV